jgi:hypothetical protein
MNKPVSLLLLIPLFLSAGTAWENSPNNWDNSPNNWENSPNNWENSPNNWDSDRVIRDNSGNPTGYAVPNSNGVINIYNLDGNREGYVPR